MGHHSDKFVAAFLAELDGFTARGGVAIVSATNRKDLIDPALLERLSDVEIQVPRPNYDGASEIFRVHLPETLPFSPNGSASQETRTQLIDLALSRIFDPNGDNTLCQVKFRDGRQRAIAAAELVSGRLIKQICRAACQRAYLRDLTHGERGIRTVDIEEAVADAIERLSTTLAPHNVRSYIPTLPQDVDVVSVEPVVRRVNRIHRYLNQ
jgi:SpoVK/Ycf46/Vps4 family AAA+-type ATPase